MHPLDDAWLKIERANEHLDTLAASIQQFFESNPYSISRNEITLIGEKHLQYFIKPNLTLPKEFSLIVGDVLSNLRSSLDYVVWQLSWPRISRLIARGQKWEKPQFPICDRRSQYCGGGTKAMIQHVPRGKRHIIEQLQPYHRGKWPELELLSFLRDASNADKHRLRTPIFSETSPDVSSFASTTSMRMRFDEHSRGISFIIPERVRNKLPKYFKPQFRIEIVFDLHELGTNSTKALPLGILSRIHEFIRDEIIPRFMTY
jgi:hypothetical protein